MKLLKTYEKILKKIDENSALILGRYLTAGLGVARSLGKKNISIIWLDSNIKQIGFKSKYCIGLHCPHPNKNKEEYIDFLLKIGKKIHNKGVLLPIGDVELLSILKNKKKLENHYLIPISDLDITKILLDKYILYKQLKKFNISHPKTYFPDKPSDLISIVKKISYPCIIKPAYSAHFVLDFNTKLFIAQSQKQLIKLFNKGSKKNHKLIIQEIIPGKAKQSYGLNAYYDKNSETKNVFMYRRVREWPHLIGNGCHIENVNIPELNKIVDAFIKKIRYHGIVDAEFKKDTRDDKYKLIEINARAWMQNSLPTRCGINITYNAYMDALGKTIKKEILKEEKIKWIFMLEDIQSALESISKKELSLKKWTTSYKGKKEYAIFSWDDPLPFLISLTKSIYSIVPYLLKK